MFRMLTAICAMLLLVACVPAKDSAPETCPKAQFSALVGTDVNEAILPLSLTYRSVYPGDVVTTDHMPERLNVQLDENGVVTGLSCG